MNAAANSRGCRADQSGIPQIAPEQQGFVAAKLGRHGGDIRHLARVQVDAAMKRETSADTPERICPDRILNAVQPLNPTQQRRAGATAIPLIES
jgi:hypothetical protein